MTCIQCDFPALDRHLYINQHIYYYVLEQSDPSSKCPPLTKTAIPLLFLLEGKTMKFVLSEFTHKQFAKLQLSKCIYY